MPCRPLDEDIWHIILPLLKRPIPRWVGDSWGKKSSALQPELAVMARLNSTFHDLAIPVLYETVVCCAFDKLFLSIDHDPAKERPPVLDSAVMRGYAHHTYSSTARQIRNPTTRTAGQSLTRAKPPTPKPTSAVTHSAAYQHRASKMQCLSHVKKLLIIPPPDSRTRIPTALRGCTRLAHDSLLLAKMDTMVRALLLVRKVAPPILFPGLQTVCCGGVWRDWRRSATWPPRADVRDPLAWRQQVDRYPMSERQAAPRLLIEQIAFKSPWSKWYQHDWAPYTGWFSAKCNAVPLCVPDRRIVMSDSNISKAFPGASHTINLQVAQVWYDLHAQALVVLSSLERLSAQRKRLQASGTRLW